MFIEFDDNVLSSVKTTGLVTRNITRIEIDSDLNCHITKIMRFCVGPKFTNDDGEMTVVIPFDLSEELYTKIKRIINVMISNEDYGYKDFNDPDVMSQYKRYTYTNVTVDGETYTVPKNAREICDLSKLYISDIIKYINTDNFKLI